MFRRLIQTSNDPMLALLRFALGAVFFAHGAQKVLGWFGGAGFASTMSYLGHMGIPAFFAFLVCIAEFLGGIGLILGFLTRIAAFAIAIEMFVALFLVHIHNGFFMNWAGNKAGEGFEFHLLAIAIAVTLLVRGAGAFSFDHELEYSRPVPSHPYPQPLGG